MTKLIPSMLVALAILGCSKGVEEGPPPAASNTPAPPPATSPESMDTAQTPAPASADSGSITVLGLTMPKPDTWTEVVPDPMQTAKYTVPGADGDATLVFFYFGPGQGGGVQSNIDRWAGQFRAADGSSVMPEVTTFRIGEMPATLVELSGTYQGVGMDQPVPDQLFLSTIVDAPVGRVFIRLVGPRATVEASRADYMALIEGLRTASAGS